MMRLVLLMTVFAVVAADWPRFRGPTGMGIGTGKDLPTTWGPKENIVWKTTLVGAGTSSPVVQGDRIYLTSYSGFNVPGKRGEMDSLKLHLIALDRETGEIKFNRTISPRLPEQTRIRDDHGYASSTLVVDKDHIFAFFGKTGAIAFDLEGKELWRTELGSELNGFGSGASPILVDDLVIVNASVESQSVVALDRKTGKKRWTISGVREAWNTPVLVSVGDKTELVFASFGKVQGFDPATGDLLWTCKNDITWYIVPSVVAAEGVVYSIGGRSGIAAIAVKAGGKGDVTGTHRLWTSRLGSNVSSPIVHGGHLYWMNDNNGTAYCADIKDGKVVKEERIERPQQAYASPVLADGKLYFVGRGGRTLVLSATPELKRLGLNDLGDRSTFNASPAVSGNRLLIRSDTHLYCIGGK